MAKYYKALSNLNANRARVVALDVEIPKLQALADKLMNDVSIRTSRYGDPTGDIHATGSHGDPTQRAALGELPEDVAQLLADIRALTIERYRTEAWIELAEHAMDFLKERERMIVNSRAVDGLPWLDVVDELYERTGVMIGEKSVRRTFENAMRKIEPFFDAGTSEGIIEKRHMIGQRATA